jgi:hypothetical protein
MDRGAPDPGDVLRAAEHSAAAQIAVAADVFGAAVNHKVDPEGDRVLIDGAREGVVDRGHNAPAAADIGGGLDIGDH